MTMLIKWQYLSFEDLMKLSVIKKCLVWITMLKSYDGLSEQLALLVSREIQ